jgi:hypothetical protein
VDFKIYKMKKIILLVALAISSLGYAQDVSVTLSVDMNNYCGATINTLYVSGTFNGWSGDANPMSDGDLDGVYDVTLTLPAGTDSILYKFQANQWAIQESFSEGDPCTVTADGFTNRVLLFDGDVTVPTVCWNSCSACVVSSLEQIELNIDWEGDVIDYTVSDFGENSSSLAADPTDASNTVLKTDRSANAPTWAGTTLSTPCGFAQPIPFDADNNIITVKVYSPVAGATIRLKAEDHLDPTHSVETNATISAANTWETLTFDFSNEAPGTAAINYTYTFDMLSIFYNFDVDGATAGAQTYYCDDVVFGTEVVSTSHNVTFKVDMNEYSEPFTTIQLNGTFNGWCGACNPMSDDNGDGVWELTIELEEGPIEFKYTYDAWAGQEELAPGSPCTITTNGFTNRYLDVANDTIMDVVCWGACSACTGMPTSADVTFQVNMNNYSGSYAMVNLNGTFNGWCGSCAVMTDDNADGIYQITVNVPTNDTIEYKFTVDGWTAQEELTEGSACTITTIDETGTFTNRFQVPMADTTLGVVCWNECADCATGINENAWTENLMISPNPSNNGIFNVRGELLSNGTVQINVLDVQGKNVYTTTVANGMIDQMIDLSGLDGGMYIMNFSNDTKRSSERIFIIK